MILLTFLGFFLNAQFIVGLLVGTVLTLVINNNINSKQKAGLQSALDAARAETQKIVADAKAQANKTVSGAINGATAFVKK